ncbi:MAG TPA: PadR family transcriptional regulator [Acidimicrobiales bacterium]|nr:PadR family transcriptional regulator [Acidimicrobiales bacterium]
MPRSRNALTTTSHALLGLLALRPWTTYELAKQAQRSLGWFWPRAERKLYDEPKKLVAAGLATATEQRTGKRPRTVYAITREGRSALRAWLDEPPAPPVHEFEAMVKVFFADGGTLDQLRATLHEVERTATERLEALHAMIDESRSGPYEFAGRLPLNALGLRCELDHEQLLVDWARWARSQVDTWRSPTDAAGWDWQAALAPGGARP